jgi:small subunit ribosomal protein S13
MARIEGVNLPESKRIEYGLTYIRGIGLFRSREILKRVNISFDKRIKDLTHEEVAAIQRDINGRYKVGGELQTEIANNIRVLQEIGSYRGLRHKKGLPVRGQRSKTNARTRKGPRRAGSTVSLKRKITKK